MNSFWRFFLQDFIRKRWGTTGLEKRHVQYFEFSNSVGNLLLKSITPIIPFLLCSPLPLTPPPISTLQERTQQDHRPENKHWTRAESLHNTRMESPGNGGVKTWFPICRCGLLWLIWRLINQKRICRRIRPSRLGRVPSRVMCVAGTRRSFLMCASEFPSQKKSGQKIWLRSTTRCDPSFSINRDFAAGQRQVGR